MPNNAYRRLSWKARLKDYPFTHAVAAGIFINAAMLVMAVGFSPFGNGLGYWLLGFALVASTHILVGLQWRGSVVVGHGVEQVGHWFAMGVWLIDIWLLLAMGAWVNLAPPILFATAHAIRIFRLARQAREIKAVMREKALKVGVGN